MWIYVVLIFIFSLLHNVISNYNHRISRFTHTQTHTNECESRERVCERICASRALIHIESVRCGSSEIENLASNRAPAQACNNDDGFGISQENETKLT